ncbi:hypothetical protein, partial [Piscinibacter sp.]|uniref:hypothetical protein n=1 Tax=Piscinibacter sp. TaxID=1903157 RepID=UPI002B907B92
MFRLGKVLQGAMAVIGWLGIGAAALAAQSARPVDFAAARPSDDARYVAQWVVDRHDNRGRPFAVVDKTRAHMFVFDARGRIAGAAPALLGQARADHSAPGVGQLEPSRIPVADRTTPAGRFRSEPGINLSGEHVVWVDYNAGVAIHRLRPSPARQRRPQRLASATPKDNRVSLGCIVVAEAFYD